jgi:hypothetical protein
LGLVAGVAGVVVAGFLLPFFFDCFLVVEFMALPLSLVAGALVLGAGVCANEIPATARESARPQAAEISFFMILSGFPFRGGFVNRLCYI